MIEMKYTPVEFSRLEQLHKAEQDANLLKAFTANAYESYQTIDRNALNVLYTMFIGVKEEEDV